MMTPSLELFLHLASGTWTSVVFWFSSHSLALLPHRLCWFILIFQSLDHGAQQHSLFYTHFLCDLTLG